MYKKIIITAALVFLLIGIIGRLLNREFDVEQSIVINAGTASIHPYVNDLKQWPRWTPWEKSGRDTIIKYGNVTRGIGASQSWRGSDGNGHLHITASSPKNGIAYDIFFGDDSIPSISAIEYTALGIGKTRLTWRMHGGIDVPIIGSYIAWLISYKVDKMYQTGLRKLKGLVEHNMTDA